MILIDEYVKTLPSKSAKNSYKSNLKSYFKFLCPDPEHDKKYNKFLGIPLSPEQLKFIERYFKTKRDYKKDVSSFHQSIINAPAKTVKSKIASVKGFLMWYDVELPTKFWKQIARHTRGSRGVTIDQVPTKEELKKILSFGTMKDRSFFLTLISSGMRVGECCKIKLSDLDLETKPAKIKLRSAYTKSGNWRWTYISQEATDILRQWLLERKSYLQVAVKRLNFSPIEKFQKSANDDRVFPFNTNTSRLMWARLIRKAGFDDRDPTSGWHSMHIHCLRKYFSSHMNVGGMPTDVVEALLGHEEKLKRIYNIYSENQLGELYQKAVNHVTVFSSEGTDERINHLDDQLKEKDAEISTLKKDIETLKGQMSSLMVEKLVQLDKKIK